MNASEFISTGINLGSTGVIGFALDDDDDDVPRGPGWATIADLDRVESAIPETGAMSKGSSCFESSLILDNVLTGGTGIQEAKLESEVL